MVTHRNTTFRIARFFLLLLICACRPSSRGRHCYSALTSAPVNKKVVVTKIARTPPSSSTGGRTRGPGLPVSKDAVNACWQKGIGFSNIPYSKNFCFKSLGLL